METIPMNTWIDLNLPFRYYGEYPEPPIFEMIDIISERWRKEFGLIPSELRKKISEDEYNYYDEVVHQLIETNPSLDNDRIARKKALRIKNNIVINKILDYQEMNAKYEKWYSEQQEVIDYYAIVDKLHEDWKKENNQQSFCGLKLNNPGTLIEVKYEDEIQQYLIGHINYLAGTCDDCLAFKDNAIVLRYMIVWNPK